MKLKISSISFYSLNGEPVDGSLSKRVLAATGCEPSERAGLRLEKGNSFSRKFFWTDHNPVMKPCQSAEIEVQLIENQLLIFKRDGKITMRVLLVSILVQGSREGKRYVSVYGVSFFPGEAVPIGNGESTSVHLFYEEE